MVKKIISFLPEFLTTSFAMFWFLENYLESGVINYFALIAGLLIMIAAVTKMRLLGMVMGGVALVFSFFLGYRFYSLLATVDDASKASRLTLVMGCIFAVSLLSSVLLFFKYYRKPKPPVVS